LVVVAIASYGRVTATIISHGVALGDQPAQPRWSLAAPCPPAPMPLRAPRTPTVALTLPPALTRYRLMVVLVHPAGIH